MATDAQIKLINDLAHYAPERVAAAKQQWGDELWDLPKLNTTWLIIDLLLIKKQTLDKKQGAK